MEYRLMHEICASHQAYFVIPNYCDYPCANFFIFNERSQCYFQNRQDLLNRYLEVRKKFIVVSNTNQANFRHVFTQRVNAEPETLFLSANRYGKRRIAGNLLDEREACRALEAFIKV